MNMNKASTRTTRRQTDSQNVKDEQVLANGSEAHPGSRSTVVDCPNTSSSTARVRHRSSTSPS